LSIPIRRRLITAFWRQSLAVYLRLASNSWSSCLSLRSAGITSVCYHAWPRYITFKCYVLIVIYFECDNKHLLFLSSFLICLVIFQVLYFSIVRKTDIFLLCNNAFYCIATICICLVLIWVNVFNIHKQFFCHSFSRNLLFSWIMCFLIASQALMDRASSEIFLVYHCL
jgi:hypothetical protein